MKKNERNECYGVDLSGGKKITPADIRDAIVECFLEAHDSVLEQIKEFSYNASEEDIKRIKLLNVKMFVRAKFKEIGGDFDNPTKEDLIKVCNLIKEFAENFRSSDIINKHYNEIMRLIDML